MTRPEGPDRTRRRRRPVVAALAAVLLGALVGGCGSGDPIGGPFTGATAQLRAENVAFEPAELTLPAGVALRIVLDNTDEGIPHNVRVFQGELELGRSPTVTGFARTEVRFGPLEPARYQFACDVHPSMIGTLVVTP
ncbi:MAG: cupredoxin domain-containing protein [Chloroflexota bacterium]